MFAVSTLKCNTGGGSLPSFPDGICGRSFCRYHVKSYYHVPWGYTVWCRPSRDTCLFGGMWLSFWRHLSWHWSLASHYSIEIEIDFFVAIRTSTRARELQLWQFLRFTSCIAVNVAVSSTTRGRSWWWTAWRKSKGSGASNWSCAKKLPKNSGKKVELAGWEEIDHIMYLLSSRVL